MNETQSADGEKPWWCYICAELFPWLVRPFQDRASAEIHVSSVHGITYCSAFCRSIAANVRSLAVAEQHAVDTKCRAQCAYHAMNEDWCVTHQSKFPFNQKKCDAALANRTEATKERTKLSREETQALADFVIGATHHPLDDLESALDIVTFWKRGTASNGEAQLIETYLALDDGLKNRFRVMFPALSTALHRNGYS